MPLLSYCFPPPPLYQKPTRALYARSGLAILWPREEGLRRSDRCRRESAVALPRCLPPTEVANPHCMPKSSDLRASPRPEQAVFATKQSVATHPFFFLCTFTSNTTHSHMSTNVLTHRCVSSPPPQAGLSWLPCSLKHEQRECTASDPFEVHPLNAAQKHTPLRKTPP